MITKILKTLLMPTSILLLLLVTALIMTRKKNIKRPGYRRGGRACLVVVAVLWYMFSLHPVANSLVYFLECDYPRPAPERLEGISAVVVLCGGSNGSNTLRPEYQPGSASMRRTMAAVGLFKQSGAEYLYISGGYGSEDRPSEAEVLAGLARKLGVPDDRIRLEEKARNTFEHAPQLWHQFPRLRQQKIAVVTSALHMPRAVESFHRIFEHENVVPYPSDWLYNEPSWGVRTFLPDAGALGKSTVALVEYLGRVYYWIRPDPEVDPTDPTDVHADPPPTSAPASAPAEP